ncbi:2-phosphosulfolactate phosphatase [Streptomyces sp. NPDC003233]
MSTHVHQPWLAQSPYGVRHEWGPSGAAALAPQAACLVVVDVLSFSTAVSVATEQGTAVHPYRWRDDRAAAYARKVDAALAVGRSMATPASPWTLSPASLRSAPHVKRLVLPSPNGSQIAAAVEAGDARLVASCLRNAEATAGWLAGQGYGTPERPVAVVSAGERHPDGSLRPALEDLLGAGAVISALRSRQGVTLSPEAAAAAGAYEATADVAAAVRASVSGQELVLREFHDDVEIALELNSSASTAVMSEGAFIRA